MPRPVSSLRARVMLWVPDTDQCSKVLGERGRQVTMASATKNIWLSLVELAHPISGWAPAAIHSSLMGKVSVYANRVASMSPGLRQSGQLQLARTLQNALNQTIPMHPCHLSSALLGAHPQPLPLSHTPLPLPLEHILVCSSHTPTFKAMPLPSKVTFDSDGK